MALTDFSLGGANSDPEILALRHEVRTFLTGESANGGFTVGPGLWLRFDAEINALKVPSALKSCELLSR